MVTLAQRSFSGGEIAPALYARIDTSKYETGVRTLRNNFVLKHGGSANRSGTLFVGEVKDSSKKIRLIRFEFNAAQTYMLEFGDLYMRVSKGGAQVTESPSLVITGITQANPAVVSAAAHGFTTGDEVFISGVLGMLEINGRNFKVGATTAGTFEIQSLDGVDIDSTGFGAYISGGTAAKIFEIATPYLEVDLPELQFVQSGDIITIVHPIYAPREVSRTADDAWSIDTITFLPETVHPTTQTFISGGGAGTNLRYKVTAVSGETGEESLPGTEATKVITNVTQANPAVVSIAAHGYAATDEIAIEDIVGMTELNGRRFIAGVVTAGTFELKDLNGRNIDSTGFTAYSSAGTGAKVDIVLLNVGIAAIGVAHVLNWDAIPGASEYNIYKDEDENGIYGFLGIAGSNTFKDNGASSPDVADTPPKFVNIFRDAGNFPSTVAFIQQRRSFANTNNNTELVNLSKSGNFNNFTTSRPVQSDDAVSFTMAGRQVNAVKHLLDLGALVIMTTGGEWEVPGDADGVIKPGDTNQKQHTYHGASSLYPIIIGNNALFVQARGGIVRDLGFDFEIDGYRGNDLTIFSSHLFEGFTLVDWAYQETPHSIVWAVRSDGVLLGLTFVREQQMLAWHRHDFDGGLVENVSVIPNGQEDEVYVTVKRTIDGITKRYIERLSVRRVDDIEDSVFMDSALSLDGRNLDLTHSMTLSGGTTWANDETITITSNKVFFLAEDVGNEIHLTGSDGTLIRFLLTAFTSTTIMSGRPNKTVPVVMRNTAIFVWGKAVDEILGLNHLEGKDVSVLGDGFVVASPFNDAYEIVTVTNGKVILDKPHVVIHIGLPYISDIETLDIDTASGETLADKRSKVTNLTLHMEESRGGWAGTEPPSDDVADPLQGLFEFKLRDDENPDDPVRLITDKIDLNLQSHYNNNGRTFIRQVDPLPFSVLAVVPEGNFTFRG